MTHRIRLAASGQDMADARVLMRNYARWTEIDLCFQNFEDELAALPGKYRAPEGGLWLAENDLSATPVGVVAVRALAESACELKRLWVEPDVKGTGLGRELVSTAIAFSRDAGYREMKLDTLKNRMPAAIALYRSFGFVDAASYTHNPEPDVLFMTLKLS